MSTYYLLNSVHVGSDAPLWPGTVLDSQYDPIAKIQSAGGQLAATGPAGLATASAAAMAVKKRGGDISEALSIMIGASVIGVTGDKGPTGDAG
jgi:hypothetical protein